MGSHTGKVLDRYLCSTCVLKQVFTAWRRFRQLWSQLHNTIRQLLIEGIYIFPKILHLPNHNHGDECFKADPKMKYH
jgi:hypothetical protein